MLLKDKDIKTTVDFVSLLEMLTILHKEMFDDTVASISENMNVTKIKQHTLQIILISMQNY